MTLTHVHARKGSPRRMGLVLIASSLIAACGGGSNNNPTLNCSQGTHQEGNVCVANPPPAMSQALTDNDTSWGLLNGVVEIYNQNLAGRPSGYQDRTVNCPVSGTVHITGTVTVDSSHNLTSVSLSYAMTNCKISEVATSPNITVALVLNGTVTENGSWNSSPTTYKSASYQSTGLAINGTDKRDGYLDASIVETCDVGFSHNINGSSNTVSGTICSRPTSY